MPTKKQQQNDEDLEKQLDGAYEQYYRSGESGKDSVNGLLNAILDILMGAENVKKIKKMVDDKKAKKGLKIDE